MGMSMKPIVIDALGMIPKDLEEKMEELEIKGRILTIQISAVLRWARIMAESWRPEEYCKHSDFNESLLANIGF